MKAMEPVGKLKEILRLKKWNQMELAGKLGVSEETMIGLKAKMWVW